MTWPPAPGEEPVSKITTLGWLTGQQHLDEYRPPDPGSSNGNGHQAGIVQPPGDRAGAWLRLAVNAAAGLALAGGGVSNPAQHQPVYPHGPHHELTHSD